MGTCETCKSWPGQHGICADGFITLAYPSGIPNCLKDDFKDGDPHRNEDGSPRYYPRPLHPRHHQAETCGGEVMGSALKTIYVRPGDLIRLRHVSAHDERSVRDFNNQSRPRETLVYVHGSGGFSVSDPAFTLMPWPQPKDNPND